MLARSRSALVQEINAPNGKETNLFLDQKYANQLSGAVQELRRFIHYLFKFSVTRSGFERVNVDTRKAKLGIWRVSAA